MLNHSSEKQVVASMRSLGYTPVRDVRLELCPSPTSCRTVNHMQEIKRKIFTEIDELSDNKNLKLSDQTPLLGDGAILDSMKVVTLCLALEDLAIDFDFDFDWTSDASMSRSRSMFRTVGTLTDEFLRQMQAKG